MDKEPQRIIFIARKGQRQNYDPNFGKSSRPSALFNGYALRVGKPLLLRLGLLVYFMWILHGYECDNAFPSLKCVPRLNKKAMSRA